MSSENSSSKGTGAGFAFFDADERRGFDGLLSAARSEDARRDRSCRGDAVGSCFAAAARDLPGDFCRRPGGESESDWSLEFALVIRTVAQPGHLI